MIKARGIVAVGALAIFSVLIVLSVGGWSDFLNGAADIRSLKTGDAKEAAVDGTRETFEATLPSPDDIRIWGSVEDLPENIAVFRTVFWEPQDTTSLRTLIRSSPLVQGKTVLEIGTGSGLVALCCLQAGARKVVATDINPMAVANARYNARLLGIDERIDVRLVSETDPGAFAVVGHTERFDLIISNPPWEDATPNTIGEYALYDSDFALMRSILTGMRDHLKPDGKALLVYGCVSAIKTIVQLGAEFDLAVEILDDRDLGSLPEVFLPGMLLSVTRKERADSSNE
jgi:release factor glutamine methyltransferase